MPASPTHFEQKKTLATYKYQVERYYVPYSYPTREPRTSQPRVAAPGRPVGGPVAVRITSAFDFILSLADSLLDLFCLFLAMRRLGVGGRLRGYSRD